MTARELAEELHKADADPLEGDLEGLPLLITLRKNSKSTYLRVKEIYRIVTSNKHIGEVPAGSMFCMVEVEEVENETIGEPDKVAQSRKVPEV